ncbi:MAG TPA: hypothetical protein VGB18_02690 [Candidatus Thermoplasmatota archaeon]
MFFLPAWGNGFYGDLGFGLLTAASAWRLVRRYPAARVPLIAGLASIGLEVASFVLFSKVLPASGTSTAVWLGIFETARILIVGTAAWFYLTHASGLFRIVEQPERARNALAARRWLAAALGFATLVVWIIVSSVSRSDRFVDLANGLSVDQIDLVGNVVGLLRYAILFLAVGRAMWLLVAAYEVVRMFGRDEFQGPPGPGPA